MPFTASSPALKRLDASTECPICKTSPFFGPVSIACGHSFCSRCIRDSLNAVANAVERRCPVCGEPAKESDVRRNRSLEEISEAWQEARTEIQSLISKHAGTLKRKVATSPSRPAIPQQTSSSSSSAIPRINGEHPRSSHKRQRLSDSPLRGRTRSVSASASGSGGRGDRSGSTSPAERDTRGMAPRPKVNGSAFRRSSGDVVILDGSSDLEGMIESEIVSEEGGDREDEVDDGIEIVGEQANDPDRLVTCPICSAQVPLGHIDAHISRGCPPPSKTSKLTQAKGWNAIFSGTSGASIAHEDPELWTKRIRKPNWNMAGDKELRGILGSYGLATEGDKGLLGERLRLWISLFNANLDTNYPKNKLALRGELARQEKAVHRDREDAARAKKAYKDAAELEDDDVFRKLIADVRERQGRKNVG